MKKKLTYIITLLLLLPIVFTVTINVYAEEWPMFHHDPENTGYTTSAGPETNLLRWEYVTDEGAGSSPAVVDDKVYVGSTDGNIYCLDAADGRKLWNYKTEKSVISSPAVVDGKLYIGSTDNNVYCLDAADGRKLWNYKTEGQITTSPAVVDDNLYIGSDDNNVYCLAISDGTKKWSYITEGSVSSSPSVVGDKLYIGSNDGNVYCLETSNGNKIWSYTTHGLVLSSPTVVIDQETAPGRIYVGSTDHNMYCLHAGDGEELWSFTTLSTIISSPTVADNKVYINSGITLYCLDGDTGEEIWTYSEVGSVMNSPIVAADKVYFGQYVGSETILFTCFNAADGMEVWSYEIEGYSAYSPAVSEGRVYVSSGYTSGSGTIYCFGNEAPETPDAPTGQSVGELEEKYDFSVVTSDADDDSIYYMFDWDDGSESEWIGPYDSGEIIQATKSWDTEGIYEINVKAKDNYGTESEWSSEFVISISLPSLITDSPTSVVEEDAFTVTITSDELSIENAQVEFNNEIKTTDMHGQVIFTAPEVKANTDYAITATLEGYTSDSKSITVLNQREDIGFAYGIATRDNVPIADVKIELINAGKSRVTYTNVDGSYSLSAPPGEYVLNVKKEGYISQTDEVNIISNTAKNFDFILQESITSDPSEDLDEQFIQSYLTAQKKDDKIAGQISGNRDPSIEIYNDQYDIELQSVTDPNAIIKVQVEGDEGASPQIFIFKFEDAYEKITVQLDGETLPVGLDLSEFFSFDNPNEEYMILSLKESTYVFVSVLEFSEHTITISSVVDALGGTTAILFYFAVCLIAGTVFLSYGLSGPVIRFIFKRKKQ